MGVVLGWIGGGAVYAIMFIYLFFIEKKHDNN